MRNYTLSLSVAVALWCLPLFLSAQTDSSRYDIGYVTLNKSFTQTITIRGEDLEKMPFVNLSGALHAWLLGAYVQPGMLAYVVDGNPVTDVDMYPIYDIEEVIYVHNAVGTAAYGNSLQELVLIATRSGKEKEGIRVAAQTGLVKGNIAGDDTHSGMYHQYYLGAYRNMDKVSFGASAGWQQDIQPAITSLSPQFPPGDLQRWRLNGWLDWRPDKQDNLRVTMGYSPQRMSFGFVTSTVVQFTALTKKMADHLLAPTLTWKHRWGRGWLNKFDAGYLHRTGEENDEQLDSNTYSGSNSYQVYDGRVSGKTEQLALRDRLSLEEKTGAWQFVPALDISYQRIREQSYLFQFQQSTTLSAQEMGLEQNASLFYLTPAVEISLAKAWNAGGGVMVNAGSRTEGSDNRLFPFATTAIDLLGLNVKQRGSSLKLFGSYARRPLLYVIDYSLGDVSEAGGGQNLYGIYRAPANYFINNIVNGLPGPGGNQPGYWTWETGVAYSTAKGRVNVQYGYERRNFSLVILNGNYFGYEPSTGTFHHMDMRFRVIDSKETSWLTAFNMTLMRTPGGVGNTFSGGWVNRLQSGRFSAGLDLVYLFHSGDSVFNPILPSKVNSAELSNIYAGYRWKLGPGTLEFFFEARGLLRSKNSDMPDIRKFYTVGGSYSL
jgi:hypothetical protein